MSMPYQPNGSSIEVDDEQTGSTAGPQGDASHHDIAQRRLSELVRRLGGGDSLIDDLDSAAADEVVQPIDIDSIARLRLVDRIAALEDDSTADEPVSTAISGPIPHHPEVTDAGIALDLGALRSALIGMAPASLPVAVSEAGQPPVPRLELELDSAADSRDDVASASPSPPTDTLAMPMGEASTAPAAEARLADIIRHQRTLLDRLTTIEPEDFQQQTIPETWQPPPLPVSLGLPAPAEEEEPAAPIVPDVASQPRLIDLLKPVSEPLKTEPANASLIEAIAVAKPKDQPAPPLPPLLRLPLAPQHADRPPPAASVDARRPNPDPQRGPEAAEGRSPMIIERARAEMSAKSTAGPTTQVEAHPSGVPGLVAGFAASIVIAVIVYGSV